MSTIKGFFVFLCIISLLVIGSDIVLRACEQHPANKIIVFQGIGLIIAGFLLLELLYIRCNKDKIYQCGNCNKLFKKLIKGKCPNCGSNNWLDGYIKKGDF